MFNKFIVVFESSVFMKTNRNLYLFAAALVAGTMGMTSCSNEEMTPNNPTFDGESVKTQFAINIPAAGNTRMTGANTQQPGQNFLGMRDIKLIPMTGSAPTTTTFSSIINLPGIGNTDITNGTANSKVYENVNVPVGTKNFLFYGVGGTTAPSTDANRFAQGVLNSSMATSNVADIEFTLQGAKITNGTQDQSILTVLNAVAQVANWSTQGSGTLKDLYDNFITLKAGSAASVCQTLENLYNSVDALAKGSDGTEKTIALAIQAAIQKDSYFSVTGGAASAPYELTTSLTYPRNINMPDGAAILSYESTGKTFSYNTTNPTIGTTLGVKMDDICFPAPIYYSVNTELAANNSVPTTWPSTVTDWENAFTTGWGNTVTTSTRAIALKKAIQYGVAQLELSVKCDGSLLEDSKGNSVSVPADGFKVTGVLIGGQPSKVGWDFKPYTAANFDKVVYDNAINGTVAAKADAAEGTNYTLVLDNYQATEQPVNIAIELENDANEFYGVEGVVPSGSKFYLIAQLNPDGKTVSDVTDPYVFMQDYKTKATLTIKSLKNAYNTIPDLRATQLSLGLAVDLTWKDGIVFDVEIQ